MHMKTIFLFFIAIFLQSPVRAATVDVPNATLYVVNSLYGSGLTPFSQAYLLDGPNFVLNNTGPANGMALFASGPFASLLTIAAAKSGGDVKSVGATAALTLNYYFVISSQYQQQVSVNVQAFGTADTTGGISTVPQASASLSISGLGYNLININANAINRSVTSSFNNDISFLTNTVYNVQLNAFSFADGNQYVDQMTHETVDDRSSAQAFVDPLFTIKTPGDFTIQFSNGVGNSSGGAPSPQVNAGLGAILVSLIFVFRCRKSIGTPSQGAEYAARTLQKCFTSCFRATLPRLSHA